jgi:DNA-binding transcriptional ArsR family regulator
MANILANVDVHDAAYIARIFKCVANVARLRVLLALAPGDFDTSKVSTIFPDLAPSIVASELKLLCREKLAKRRAVGRRRAYSLSDAGYDIAQACQIILVRHRPDAMDDTEQQFVGRTTRSRQVAAQRERPASAPDLVETASLLNHAASPLRVRLLLMLTEGGRDSAQLRSAAGSIELSLASKQLSVLSSGGLVQSHHSGKQRIYTLTPDGLSLVQVLRATCSGLSIRRGRLTLCAGPEDGLDQTSADQLAGLLKAFAHPIRLRVFSLLVAADEVCIFDLAGALKLPRFTVMNALADARRKKLVLGRRAGKWTFLRPAPAAADFYRGLIGCFGTRLREAEILKCDERRLARTSPCGGAPSPSQQDAPSYPEGRGSSAGRCGVPVRIA